MGLPPPPEGPALAGWGGMALWLAVCSARVERWLSPWGIISIRLLLVWLTGNVA